MRLNSYSDLVAATIVKQTQEAVPGLTYENNLPMEKGQTYFVVCFPVGEVPRIRTFADMEDFLRFIAENDGNDMFVVPGFGSLFDMTIGPTRYLRSDKIAHAYDIAAGKVCLLDDNIKNIPTTLYYLGSIEELMSYGEERHTTAD